MSIIELRTWSATTRKRTSSPWSAPYFLPVSCSAFSMTGNITSISYMLSRPCIRNATRSRPMPVSMFFFGRDPAMSKSALDRTAESSSCMKTRFQISSRRSSSSTGMSGPREVGSKAGPYASPRS